MENLLGIYFIRIIEKNEIIIILFIIRCYCDASNCSGMIDGNTDEPLSDDDRGFYRDPQSEDYGDILVSKRIRIWRMKRNTFSWARVKRYEKREYFKG